MPWADNIVKTMTSNGKQFTVTREMLTAVARDQRWPDVVAGISARFSKFAFVLFCYITNHLMTGPLGKSEFCFPRISMFPSTSSRETLRFSGNKIHCSPRDQSLSVKYCLLSSCSGGSRDTTITRFIHILLYQLVNSLPFYIPEAWEVYAERLPETN